MIVHANLIAAFVGGRWKGVLIEGASGSGKSDLSLRALGEGFRLVADDRVLLWTSGGRLWGRAPDVLKGLMEVRGLDVVKVDALPFAEVALICSGDGTPDRLPEPKTTSRLGTEVRALQIAPLETSAARKLMFALQHLGERP
jgi:serine kinase of HPr protein (carbohydrate metabolism regulator)